MEPEFPRQVFKKYSNIQWQPNYSSDGRTDRYDDANRLFAILRRHLKIKIYHNRIQDLNTDPADIQTLRTTTNIAVLWEGKAIYLFIIYLFMYVFIYIF